MVRASINGYDSRNHQQDTPFHKSVRHRTRRKEGSAALHCDLLVPSDYRLQMPHVPPCFAQCLHEWQFLHAIQGSLPVQVDASAKLAKAKVDIIAAMIVIVFIVCRLCSHEADFTRGPAGRDETDYGMAISQPAVCRVDGL